MAVYQLNAVFGEGFGPFCWDALVVNNTHVTQ
jgi:hypothetical protein